MARGTSTRLPGRALRRQRDGQASVIIKVKRIWTGGNANPWAEAVAVRDGVFAAVGTAAEVDQYRGPHTRVIVRPELFALPGLMDAHGHMQSLGATQEQLDLRGVGSLEEVERRVKERAVAVAPGSWITGRNWDQSLWPGGEFPTAAVLDRAAPFIRCGCGASTATPAGPIRRHCGWPRSTRTPRPRRAARSSVGLPAVPRASSSTAP